MAANRYSHLPLHTAALAGREAVVRLLLEAAPAAAMPANGIGQLPLHCAARASRNAAARLLLESAPAAAMAADRYSHLPLHAAARTGRDVVVRLLLDAAPQAAAEATADGDTPLQLALNEGRAPMARALLSAGPAAAVLAALAAANADVLDALPLFCDFLLAPGRLPLAAADWALVPLPYPGIERALPAALACGADQAAQVVRRRAAAACRGL